MLRFDEQDNSLSARIKVIGVGGGGTNAVDHMLDSISCVEFAVVNTDVQALSKSDSPEKIQIGKKTSRGMGTGGNPERGRQAALDDKELLVEMLEGIDIVFITAGFGGGTGTGAAPVIAQLAHDLGALTVGVITKPFTFEGRKRMAQAEQGIREFREHVDTIVCIPNDKLFDMISQDTPLHEAYRLTDKILHQSVNSISRVITQPGLINLDFSDIRSILSIKGGALIGFGEGNGKDKAAKAIQAALASPLLEVKELRGSQGVLISIIGGHDLSLYEVNNAIGTIHEIVDDNADIIIGAIIQDDLKDRALVTLIATGLPLEAGQQIQSHQPKAIPSYQADVRETCEAAESTEQSMPEEESRPVEREEEEDSQENYEIENEAVSSEYVEETEEEPDNEYDYENSEETESNISTFKNAQQRLENVSQNEFFDDSDPTMYGGTNLDIPSFMRKKKQYAGNDQ